MRLTLPISMAITVLLRVLVVSYRRVIAVHPKSTRDSGRSNKRSSTTPRRWCRSPTLGVARLTHAAAIDGSLWPAPQDPIQVLTIAPAGRNVNQVETLNQSGMRSAVRRCPRRAVARAEHTGDNRMSGITMKTSPARFALLDGGFLSQPWRGRTARLASRRLRSSVAVISAHGGIDASNADTLTEYTLAHLMHCRGLILDLRDLDFFGTEGFSALHRVSVPAARAGIGWALVPGEAVSRVLRIGDPEGLLPAASTVEAAMATVQGQPHRSPQPIASRLDPGQSSRCERTVCLVCGGTQRVQHEEGTTTEAIAKLDGPALTLVDAGVRRCKI